MANSTLIIVVLSLLAVTAAARPCKTLFFVTTTSYYSFPTADRQNPNPIFPFRNPTFSPRFQAIFFSARNFPDEAFRFGFDSDPIADSRMLGRIGVDVVPEKQESKPSSSSIFPVEFYSSVTSSIRDRTKDIMSVVGALLFGVGCGALTAATMYLIWSLFAPNRFEFEDSDDDFEDDVSPKKMGYVAIPDDSVKKHAPAKEVA